MTHIDAPLSTPLYFLTQKTASAKSRNRLRHSLVALAIGTAMLPFVSWAEIQVVIPVSTGSAPTEIALQGKPKRATETASVASSKAQASTAGPSATTTDPVTPATVKLTGRIVDENGRPLVGATVLLQGTSRGTSTDANGNYSLEVPTGGQHDLVFGYGGYDDQELTTRSTQSVDVTLTPRAKSRRRR